MEKFWHFIYFSIYMFFGVDKCLAVEKGPLNITVTPTVDSCIISWEWKGQQTDRSFLGYILWHELPPPDSIASSHRLNNATDNFTIYDLLPGKLSRIYLRIRYSDSAFSDTGWLECRTLIPVQKITMEVSNGSMEVVTGDIIQTTCVTSACLPPSSVTWYIGDSNVTQSSNSAIISANDSFSFVTRSTLYITAEKGFNKMKITCVAKNIEGERQIGDTHLLSILYPPEVMVRIPMGREHQKRIAMSCEAYGGNPRQYNYTGWQHYYNGKYIRQFGGVGIGKELVLQDLTYEDIGNYKCYVHNNIKTNQGKRIIAKGLDALKIEVTPKLFPNKTVYRTPMGVNLTVEIPFLLFTEDPPGYTDVLWRNMTDNTLLQNSVYVTHQIRPLTFNISMHGQTIAWHGYSAFLQITGVQDRHYGPYSLEVRNLLGATNITITIDGNITEENMNAASRKRFERLLLTIIVAGSVFVLFLLTLMICCKVKWKKPSKPKPQGSVKSERGVHRNSNQQDNVVFHSEVGGYISPVEDNYMSPTLDESDHTYEVPALEHMSRRPFASGETYINAPNR